jgi:hypothetical protein
MISFNDNTVRARAAYFAARDRYRAACRARDDARHVYEAAWAAYQNAKAAGHIVYTVSQK